MKATNDLEFLTLYWGELKNIQERITRDLPQGTIKDSEALESINISNSKMFFIPFSKLGNTWSPSDIIKSIGGRSRNLERLAEKLCHMIERGNSNSILPFLKSTLAKGYWINRMSKEHIVLTTEELRMVKEYFKLKV
jgi:hypothetical protein